MAVTALALVVTGCSAEERERPVRDVASAFYRSLADGDGATACALLAPATRSGLAQSAGKPCPRAVLEEKLPTPQDDPEVDVYDNAGQVRYGAETSFLAEFPDGWRVVAAGCTPRDARPYDCTVSGG